MRLARYVGSGLVEVMDEPAPALSEGGILVKTEACGLCSGELMDWYLDQKVPHVLGHEVCGVVEATDDPRFPVGQRVFVHHHSPCMKCEFCRRRAYVHCTQWKATRLIPGGMAEYFVAPAQNLNDAFIVDLPPREAALIEPLGCVVKSLARAGFDFGTPSTEETEDEVGIEDEEEAQVVAESPCAVVGLGSMGLMHLLMLPDGSVGFENNPKRIDWAKELGLDARLPATNQRFETVIVCPGTEEAIRFGLEIAAPDATVVLFAPMPPHRPIAIDFNATYFRDLKIVTTYSCGPEDTRHAADYLAGGLVSSDQVVSDFIGIDDLPRAYQAMRQGEILKAMVMFE